MNTFTAISVTVGLVRSHRHPWPSEAVNAAWQSVLAQDHVPVEILLADDHPAAAPPPAAPPHPTGIRVHHLPGSYANDAALYNALLAQARGAFLLLIPADRGPIELKRSALQTMVMAATRTATTPPPALVYADYQRRQPDGTHIPVHLLDWHPGRLRDAVDFGPVILYPTALLRELGGFNERFTAAHLYDLRLRLTEKSGPLHIANRFDGALYTVTAPGATHDVFAYLRAVRSAQLEMEQACTAHLRRTGAYLAPGAHLRPVTYTAAEQQRFTDCLASVVIPVHCRPGFIHRAIESVHAQTQPRVEVIVAVNGGPDDPTAAQVRRYLPGGDRHRPDAPPVRLLVLDVNNIGLCLNAGLAAARGKYYVQLDSDDRLKPDAVARLLAVFDADPTVGMVIGAYEVWTLDETTGDLRRNAEIPVVTHEEWTADNGRNNLLRINGAGAPRAAHIKVIQELGWFGVNDSPHARNYGEDYDLVLRLSERYTIGRVWEPIYEVIRHSGGTDHAIDQATIDRNDETKDHMRRMALQRRQALNASAAMAPVTSDGT